jgi:hypothetical protein
LHSRCAVIDFTIQGKDKEAMVVQAFRRMVQILTAESVTFDKNALAAMIGLHFPDMRRLLNELQRKGTSGDITAASIVNDGETNITALVGFLKDKNFKELRRWTATTPSLDIGHVSHELYDRMYDICQHDDMPQLITILADYMYKDAFVSDKEINIMAMFCELLASVRFK